MTIFNNQTLQVLQKAMDGATKKQEAISHNMANVNTPGFKRVEVSFQDQLQRALGSSNRLSLSATSDRHITGKGSIQSVTSETKKDNSTSMRVDGNNVDIDKEMNEMAQNTIYLNMAVAQTNKRIGILRNVISEGRR